MSILAIESEMMLVQLAGCADLVAIKILMASVENTSVVMVNEAVFVSEWVIDLVLMFPSLVDQVNHEIALIQLVRNSLFVLLSHLFH